MIRNKFGIDYKEPVVTLLQDSGLGVAEYAGRVAYDSFDKSENECVKNLDVETLNDIEHSELLDKLAWVNFHHSVLEHSSLSYLIEGTSRGVLQEHARHRIQSISVRSTRYTMSSVINAYLAVKFGGFYMNSEYGSFYDILDRLNIFVTTNTKYNNLQIADIWNKFNYQYDKLGKDEFLKISTSKDLLNTLTHFSCEDELDMFIALEQCTKKRNVGDAFKHIVNDNWKVDMVVTFNLRSLKNYFALRDSGSAYFQIQWLAKLMKEATPKKYLDLICK